MDSMRFGKAFGLIYYLSRRALVDKFSGTSLGSLWGILNPVLLFLTYYLVFSVGFKVEGENGSNYAIWLVAGLLPWLFFSDAVIAVTCSLKSGASLIKRLYVPAYAVHLASLAPPVIFHISLLIAYCAIAVLVYGVTVSPILLIGSFLYLLILVFSLGLIFSVLHVYLPDTLQVLQAVFGILFWMTPVIWPSRIMDQTYAWVVTLNPLAFLVDGYRKALVFPATAVEYNGLLMWTALLCLLAVSLPIYRNIKRVNDFI